MSLTIVAILPAAGDPTADPDAVQVFACDFESGDKLDAEGIPAGWSRRLDAQCPHYLPIRLAGEAATGRTCLRIDLDGGAAELRSPRLPVEGHYAYFVEAQIRTDGLEHDAGFISLTLLDRGGRQLEHVRSQIVGHSMPWTRVRIGPLPAGKAHWGVVGLHLASQASDPFAEFDLRGTACFDALRVVRVPLVQLETPDALHLYSVGQDVSISCVVTGAAHRPEFSLTLEDIREPAAASPQVIEVRPIKGQAESWSWLWQQCFERPGFYCLRVSRMAAGQAVDTRRIPLAVIDVLPASSAGDFGWTLPALDDAALSTRRLRLLEEARVGWVKVPLWLASGDAPGHRRAVELFESMRRRQIAVIGVLAEPPRDKQAGLQPPKPAAQLFAKLDDRQAQSLTATLARYGLQVSAWQVGRDGDASFAQAPDPAAAWQALAERVRRVAGDVEIGTFWPASVSGKSQGRPPWPLVCMAREQGESDRELADRLAKVRSQGADVMLDMQASDDLAGDAAQASMEQAASLIHRMLAAKVSGVQFIGFEDPLNPARGMIDRDGACQPRLLAWRTAAWAIGAGQYAGDLVLPGGSRCEVFLDESRAMLVVWSDVPTQERLHLGAGAEVVDALGWRTPIATGQGQQSLQTDRIPRFVSGADPEIARWRIASRLEHDRFPTVFGLKHRDALEVTNTFEHPVAGQVTIVPPPGWKVHPQQLELKLAAGQQASLPFEMFIPLAGTTGSHLLRFDVEVQSEPRRRFEVYHHILLGDEHLRLTVRSSINAAGELEVTQRCENTSSEAVTLRCNLFAPGERRLRWQVPNLASGSDEHVYRLSDGERFRDQTLWVRAEEVGGPRVLSYRFVVAGTQSPADQKVRQPSERTARAIW
ncbi:MAG TPA: hypothetical protein VG433_10380 [Pirellulales bacterium]|nr:hypothetical protein [Pirellulales bacterium]